MPAPGIRVRQLKQSEDAYTRHTHNGDFEVFVRDFSHYG